MQMHQYIFSVWRNYNDIIINFFFQVTYYDYVLLYILRER